MFSLKNYASLTLPKDWLSNYILQLWKQNHWSNYLHVHPQKKPFFVFLYPYWGFELMDSQLLDTNPQPFWL
jgi:hypothetical protein